MHDHTYYLRLSSQHYLIDEIPSNWGDMPTEEQDKFLALNAWQPFQDMTPDELIGHILDLANAFKRIANNERIATLSEVHERLESSSASFNQTKTEDQ